MTRTNLSRFFSIDAAQLRAATVASLALFAVACGGGTKGAAGPAAGSEGGPGQVGAMEEDGTPMWIRRGSGAFSGEAGKAFYGVGLASGIKNPSMLRTTADNRARAELGKVFEVYSASLMKDYMASTNGKEQQAVEQAVKTFSSTALQGVEIVDHYVGEDGSLYALAQLTLERAKAAQGALAEGIATSHTTKVSVDDIFDKHAKKTDPPRRPPPQEAKDDGSQETPPPSVSATAKERKEKPAWVDGPDSNYPSERWLCAVGFGPDRAKAQNAAYAALSRIFVVRVASISKDFMGAYSKTGAQDLEVQSSETYTRVATAKIFSGVTIPEVWQGGEWYALACLDRDQAATHLRETIEEKDTEVGKRLAKAKATDKAARVKELAKALNALVERAALNGELRIVNVSGLGEPSRYNHVDVAAAFEAAVEQLKVAVVTEGPFADDFYTIFAEALTKKGFKVFNGATDEADVLVSARLKVERAGKAKVAGVKTTFARIVANAEVTNVAKNQSVGAFSVKSKQGGTDFETAQSQAVRVGARDLAKDIGKKLEAAMMQ